MTVDCSPPLKLYRYGERVWLERAVKLGEFLLKPASSVGDIKGDATRQDDELVRTRHSPADKIKIVHMATGNEIKPISAVKFESKSLTDFLIICFSRRWDASL
jgi:hypothetical protein